MTAIIGLNCFLLYAEFWLQAKPASQKQAMAEASPSSLPQLRSPNIPLDINWVHMRSQIFFTGKACGYTHKHLLIEHMANAALRTYIMYAVAYTFRQVHATWHSVFLQAIKSFSGDYGSPSFHVHTLRERHIPVVNAVIFVAMHMSLVNRTHLYVRCVLYPGDACDYTHK